MEVEKMPTLYDLTNEYLEVLDLANDPEIPPDVVADTLEAIGGDIETFQSTPSAWRETKQP